MIKFNQVDFVPSTILDMKYNPDNDLLQIAR